jgi:hypothetical protein
MRQLNWSGIVVEQPVSKFPKRRAFTSSLSQMVKDVSVCGVVDIRLFW